MTGRIDHTAVVVADLNEALLRWQTLTGGLVGHRCAVPDQHVEVAMLHIGDTQIELVCPDDHSTGVRRFLDERGESLHHVGLLVEDIEAAIAGLTSAGFEFIDRGPRLGADGRVAFLKPRSTGGVLLELISRAEELGHGPEPQ